MQRYTYMFKTLNALVLREVRYKEADRILTLLTDTEGKITAKARGALRKSSRTAAATQQLTYAEMTLFGNRGRWTINEAVVKEPFEGLRGDMEKLALAAYIAECAEALSVEEQPEPELMQLSLNCLYALSRDLGAQEKIKAAFEARLMCLSGYAPELGACAVCGREPAEPVLNLDNGCLCCRSCGTGARYGGAPGPAFPQRRARKKTAELQALRRRPVEAWRRVGALPPAPHRARVLNAGLLEKDTGLHTYGG